MKKLLIVVGMLISTGLFLAACSVPAAPLSVESASTAESVQPLETPVPTSSPSLSSSDEDGIEVELDNFAFVPAELTIKVGSRVTWTNKDSAVHDVQASDGSWASGSLSEGQSFSRVFDAEGTYEYVCSFHPAMRGKIIVVQ